MKKKSLLFASLLMGIIVFFSSCEKEITSSEVIIDLTKTGTLKLYVKAELDIEEDGLEMVPNGTVFNISVNKTDLNGSFTGTDRWKTSDSTLNGVVEVNVPATSDGVTVYVDAVTFEAMYEINDTTIQHRKYEYSSSFAVKEGQNKIESITLSPVILETIYN